jgi:hypothetical protein
VTGLTKPKAVSINKETKPSTKMLAARLLGGTNLENHK